MAPMRRRHFATDGHCDRRDASILAAGVATPYRLALEQFRQGGLEKVVLSRRSTLRVDLPTSQLELSAASEPGNHRYFHYLMT